jgi:hypothetical protein
MMLSNFSRCRGVQTNRSGQARAAGRMMEPLESRVLMSTTAGIVEDSFQLGSGTGNNAEALAQLGGNLFAAGYATDAHGIDHGIVRERTTDANGVASWKTVLDYNYVAGKNTFFYGIAADAADGSLYVVGNGTPASGVQHWLALKCLPPAAGNGTWSAKVSDDYQLTAGQSANAWHVAVDARGDAFATGNATASSTKTTSLTHWIVRELNSPTAASPNPTWHTIQNYQYVASTSAYARGIALAPAVYDASGAFNHQDVFVGGAAADSTSNHWITQKSTVGPAGDLVNNSTGTTWQTVDNFQAQAGVASSDYGMGIYDSGGGYDVYAVGQAMTSGSTQNNKSFEVRQGQYNPDGSARASWQEVLRLAPTTNNSNCAYAFAFSGSGSGGRLYVAGGAADASNHAHAVVMSSDASGKSWTQVDNWQLDSSHDSVAFSLAADPSFGMIDAGEAADASGYHWFARQVAAPLTASVSTPAAGASTITFNHAVSGFDLSDLTLAYTDASGNVTTTNLSNAQGVSLTTTDNVTWTLGGLSSLTTASGTNTLTLHGQNSGIIDGYGLSLLIDVSASWAV